MAGGHTDHLRAHTHLERARHYFAVAKFEEALNAFDAAIAADASLLYAFSGKALTLTQLGRYDEAAAVCRETISREPSFAMAYVALGSALHYSGHPADALAYYRKALTLAPDDGLVVYNFACYWAREGNGEECRPHLERALELEPKLHQNAALDAEFKPFRAEPWFDELTAFKKAG
jgi:tetratricopeptide (TPR) repeat protein